MRRQAIAIAWVVGLVICAASEPTMPVGIPSPGWNWYGNVSDFYTNADYYTYWIDNTHTNATDTSNTYGSPDKPRLTLPTLTALTAGTVVRVEGGPYSSTARTYLSGAGTETNPVMLVSTSGAVLSNYFSLRSCTNLIVSGFSIKYPTIAFDVRGLVDGEAIKNFCVRNCTITGSGAQASTDSGFNIGTSVSDGDITGVLSSNIITYYGDWEAVNETPESSAIALGRSIDGLWVLWCEGAYCGGDGIIGGHAADHASENIYVGGCTWHHNRENGIDLKEIHNVVVSGCLFHDFVSSSSSSGEAMVSHYGPTPGEGTYNVFVINNEIRDSEIGIITTGTSSTHDLWWVGNIVYDCDTGISPDRSDVAGTVVRVWNNTVYNCTDGILSEGAAVTSIDIRNNIVVDCGDSYLIVANSTTRSGSDASNECYYESGGGQIIISWSSTYTNVAAWIAGTTVGDDSIEADPLFTDAAGGDFTLLSGSPCIDAGYDITSDLTNDYYTVFGVELVYKDRAGTVRPVNGTWDIGAYEYDVDTNAPVVTNVVATVTGQTTCTVTWTTDESCPTNTVEYSTDESYGDSETATAGTSHTSYLTSLSSDTTYNYRVISWDYAGNSTTNTPSTFDTLAPPEDPTVGRVGGSGKVSVSGNVKLGN